LQHVKLARDRRKRKSRLKAAIFFAALLLILTGIFLAFKDTADYDPSLQSNLEPEMVDNVQYQSLTPEKTESDKSQPQAGEHPEAKQHANTEDATSYDDDLQAKDDEVDEIKPQFDELTDLPKDAQDALSGILDVADQALRITDQFSHTVVRGDSLKDVLELSGLEDDTAKNLIAEYPELKTLRAGQQFYWILDKEDQLEYLNWLVSEKEERIYERTEDGKFKRQILEKKSIWKKEVLKGTINGSFASSLRDLGLDGRQISQLSSALQWQVSLQKLSKGTKFAILVSREYLGDKLTGQGNVEAIHIMTDGKSYYGIQAANGRYYDKQGETLGKGFARYPLQRQARISSPFNPNRPYTLDYIEHIFTDFQELAGDRAFADDKAIVGGLARLDGRSVMIIGHQKGRTVKDKVTRNFGMPAPEGYRKALRLMQMAERFNLPIITFIDTPGAYPGIGAEERGQSEAIARNLREMSTLKVPVICTVIGEGEENSR
jgi:murein DD-endopeptidase